MTIKKTGNIIWVYILLAVSIFIISGFISAMPMSKKNTELLPDSSLLKLSETFLYQVKTETSTAEIELKLASIDRQLLIDGLDNDDAIKTFWVNMYNAWYQILAVREKQTRPKIFTGKMIPIAGVVFSLDDIEHGILRKYRWKYSKGYLPKFFPGRLIKQLAVAEIDYRIHFALNCGAKSCPPIAFYTYKHIDKQLDLAAKSFLTTETEIDDVSKTVYVTKIMDWFRGDFNGKKGIKKIIKQFLKMDISDYRIEFKPYNWDEALHNFDETNLNLK
jgi:hypothetical protein